ncbi:GDNF family receptor alpha-1 [Falco naumanni]|uniref:GDNF family receptor alpha-1 n=1 Tax=Falco naumanni TaxID=148594 RepID=UPI001ADE9428|nr:GDNF family receptor alpha-1 [Falco naumanni]
MFLVLLYFALPLVDVLLSAEVSGLPGGDRLDCVKASDQCLKEQSCSTKYRTLRQCVAGKESNFSRATGLEAKDECKSAMEALKQKSLYNCRCKRGMKKEKNCLRIYWSMYQSLQGNDLLEDSPYEPVNSRLSDIFRLAPIVSVEPVLSKGNNCLDAAKACNLNDTCKRFRSAYITPCTSSTSNEICNKRKCHKALRLFFDKVPPKHSYGMLFCSCRDVACTERRRQTIVPVCSYEDREKPNCLNLQESCKKNYICRSRLADFFTNCQPESRSVSSCLKENYADCLLAYSGLIGKAAGKGVDCTLKIVFSKAQKKRKSNESVDTELCLNENAIGKDNAAGVSTSHISSENSPAVPTSFYLSTPLTLMTLALSLCLFLSSSVVL